MQYINPHALEFLRHRRSHPPALLSGPPPKDHELMNLLELAARVPDHGKLEPWRYVVLKRSALDRMAPALEEAALASGASPEKAAKIRSSFDSPLIVAVISAPQEHATIPEWEQFLSAGAVCLELVNAALAAGYGACWLTGPAASQDFATAHLGLKPNERVAGLIHIGRRGGPPPERPRPDIEALTTVLE